MGRRRLSQPDIPVKASIHGRYAWAIGAVVGVLALVWQHRSPQLPAVIGSGTRLNVDDLLQYENMTIGDTMKRFPGDTLGFVTPWNSKGYDFVKKFARKFTMISPVWYQIGPSRALSGSHHVDEAWLNDLRQNNVQIVPRFTLEGWNAQHLFELLSDPKPFVDVIVKEVEKRRYDGVVLEATQAILFADYLAASITDIPIPSFSESVIAELGTRLKSLQKKLLIVVSPDKNISKNEAMVAFGQYVSHIVVMTYDHSSRGRAGPNAPFDWVRQTITRIRDLPGIRPEQILLGLNFYGLEHAGPVDQSVLRPIVAHEYIQLLKANKIEEISFLESEREHVVRFRDKKGDVHSVFYPTMKSIQDRIGLARELGVGLQIWELGQGFQCFFYPL